MRLTIAQRRMLMCAAKHPHGRIVGGDDRTRAKLHDAGLIIVTGYNYGPLYGITEAGRAAVSK